jgi:hypothetical protein
MTNTTAKVIYIFYGFSGDPGKVPAFPGGKDNDRSLELVAETLKDTLAALYPSDKIHVLHAWSKDIIIDALAKATEKIRQVHIACHGDSTMLSLAYQFDQGKRIRTRAKKINNIAGASKVQAIKAMKDEDALVAGFFTHAVDQVTLQKIKINHLEKAAWQIWGCYCGYASDSFSGIGDAVIDPYLKRFNMGQLSLPGIAVEIAKTLGVTCTAAKGGAGMNFWHGGKGKKVLQNTKTTPAKKPFWLWNTKGSSWVTYDASGKALAKPIIFQVARNKSALTPPTPPAWLTQAGILAAGLAIGLAKKFRAPLGKTMSKFFDADHLGRDRSERLSSSLGNEINSSAPIPPDYVNLRSSWGAKKVGTVGSVHSPKQITIHHTATPNDDKSTVEERIRNIQNYHINTKKWKDIGYHFLISSDGRVWQGRENIERTGAHVAGHNNDNIGIAFIGDYQKVAVPQPMLDSAAKLIRWLCDKYGITMDRTNIKGHREWAATTCPGDYMMAKFDELINAAQQAATAQGMSGYYDMAVGGEGFSSAMASNAPYRSLISSFSEDNYDQGESDTSWDTESATLSEAKDVRQSEEDRAPRWKTDGAESYSDHTAQLSDDEIAAEMSDVSSTLALSGDDEGDDFKEKLKQAALGQYKKDEATGLSNGPSRGGSDEKTKSRHLSHDVFNHLGHDLSHATNYDLGKHEITRRLDSFAQELMAVAEKPKLPLAAERSLAKATELDEMDLLSSLALIDDSNCKKKHRHVRKSANNQETIKDENVTERTEYEPEPVKNDIPVDQENKDEGKMSDSTHDETISQEAN